MDKDFNLFLRTVKPFDQLPESVLDHYGQLFERRVYEADTMIMKRGKTKVKYLSVVSEGKLKKYFLNDHGKKELKEKLSPGDIYGGVSILLNKTYAVWNIETSTPCIVYELADNHFLELCNKYEKFTDHFTSYFGKLMLNRSYSVYLRQLDTHSDLRHYSTSDNFFSQKIKSVFASRITSAYADTPIKEVALLMTLSRNGCILIKERDGQYIGFVTDLDLRNKVVATGHDVDAAVSEIISEPIVTIPEDAYIYEALLLMFNQRLGYLVATKDGEFTGIITRNKLLSSQSETPFIFIQSVRLATTVKELAAKWEEVPAMVHELLERGVRAEIVNQIITAVSDAILFNIVYHAIKDLGDPPVKFTFMALGSEGRKEQTLKTDQDNAIVYEDVAAEDEEVIRLYFRQLGEIVSDRLHLVGFTYCEGGYMAKNPEWCLSLSEWKAKYKNWINAPSLEAAMNSIIFFDCRAVYGESYFVDEIKAYFMELLENRSQLFFAQLAKNALELKPPLTMFRNFKLFAVEDNRKVLDIKKAMRPVIDFARVYSLKHNLVETNTGERLLAMLKNDIITKVEYHELLQAYYWMMQLRLSYQSKSAAKEQEETTNYIEPDVLTKIERVTLKEIFRIVEKYQLRLSIDFVGSLKV
ncbi:MAG: DUF294 nucleotidyltransferase-like domain-containing protein [Bacteroidota bacterium]